MTEPTHKLSKWYRKLCAEHERALSKPMPDETRYAGETHERRFFEERYEAIMKAQRKRKKRRKRRNP